MSYVDSAGGFTIPTLAASGDISAHFATLGSDLDALDARVDIIEPAAVLALTTTQRNALSGGALYRGRTIFNTTTGGLEVYYGATTLWRPPWNTKWTRAGGAENTAGQTGIGTSFTDVTSLSVTFTALANRRYKVLAYVQVQQVTS